MSTIAITLDELVALINQGTGVGITTNDLVGDAPVTFTDLAVDSLGVLGIITELELRFGLEPDSEAGTYDTPHELLTYFYRRLVADGKVDIGRSEHAIVIDAPYDEVWDQTNDVPAWPNLFSEYAAADILERTGDTVLFRLSLHPDPTGKIWSWVSERTMDKATGAVRSHRVETGAFEFMNIAWTYREVEGGVEMRWAQDFAMKAAAPIDTAGMTAQINANSVIQLALIRKRVEERASVKVM
jgi:aromatase